MQRGERQTVREGQQMKVSDLRSQFRTIPAKPAKALRNKPKAPRRESKTEAAKRDSDEDARRERAEKFAEERRTTSLLKTQPRNDRSKSYKEKKKSGLLLQLMLVMIAAAGVTVALNPSVLPPEVRNLDWQALKYQFDEFLLSVTN